MNNLLFGNLLVEHLGTMTVTDPQCKLTCVVEFKQNRLIEAQVLQKKKVLAVMEGKWSDYLTYRLADEQQEFLLWKARRLPHLSEQQWHFSEFGFNLNNITEDLLEKLPKTDSRWRKDMRALENGDLELA